MSEDKNKGETTRTTSQYRMMYGYYEDDYTLSMTREELMKYFDSIRPMKIPRGGHIAQSAINQTTTTRTVR